MTPDIRARHSLAEGLLFIASDALSDFERDLIADISARRRHLGLQAVVTEVEADVLACAVEAMEAHLMRTATAFREGFENMLGRIQMTLGGAR